MHGSRLSYYQRRQTHLEMTTYPVHYSDLQKLLEALISVT